MLPPAARGRFRLRKQSLEEVWSEKLAFEMGLERQRGKVDIAREGGVGSFPCCRSRLGQGEEGRGQLGFPCPSPGSECSSAYWKSSRSTGSEVGMPVPSVSLGQVPTPFSVLVSPFAQWVIIPLPRVGLFAAQSCHRSVSLGGCPWNQPPSFESLSPLVFSSVKWGQYLDRGTLLGCWGEKW